MKEAILKQINRAIKNITFYGESQRGYAIKTEIINELGFNFKTEKLQLITH